MKKSEILLLLILIFLTFLLRVYGLNWDSGNHMHPDERAIILYILPLHFPKSIFDFFSTQSPWNPHFFAYGSFPLYLLKAISSVVGIFNKAYVEYDNINLLGRLLTALFDTGTAIILFLLGKKLFGNKVGLLSIAFYAISVLPIQLSHFYAVDPILTFFVIVCLYSSIVYYEHPSLKKAFCVGLFLGAGLATKNSALALFGSLFITLTIEFLLIFLTQPHKPHIWLPHVPHILKKISTEGIIILLTAAVTFFLFEPYAFIDFKSFSEQTQQQYQMTHDAFTFPYTLQFVGKTPYIYEIKNIFLWGEGPVLGLFSFIGVYYVTFLAFHKKNNTLWARELIIVTFFWSYFFVVGKFAIGFMRYMLPIYPLLALFAAVTIFQTAKFFPTLKKIYLDFTFLLLFGGMFLIWPVAFLHIYSIPNTRILASKWINNTIPAGKSFATELWDDRLPIYGQNRYHFLDLSLYDPDTNAKWDTITAQLAASDYIILASARLSGPLQKLSDCHHIDALHCYPRSAEYYHKLFNGQLGFSKVAEFTVYPTIPFLNIPINDQNADESFTVFDHPKVLIFQKNGTPY